MLLSGKNFRVFVKLSGDFFVLSDFFYYHQTFLNILHELLRFLKLYRVAYYFSLVTLELLHLFLNFFLSFFVPMLLAQALAHKDLVFQTMIVPLVHKTVFSLFCYKSFCFRNMIGRRLAKIIVLNTI